MELTEYDVRDTSIELVQIFAKLRPYSTSTFRRECGDYPFTAYRFVTQYDPFMSMAYLAIRFLG